MNIRMDRIQTFKFQNSQVKKKICWTPISTVLSGMMSDLIMLVNTPKTEVKAILSP